jgi:hypothetical protein
MKRNRTPKEQARPPLAVGPQVASELLSCSRDHFDRHIIGEPRTVRRGRRILIPAGVLLLSVGLGKANAYTRARHVIYTVFPPATAPAALRVVRCETGGTFNPRARNRSGASGLFQVIARWHPWVNARRLFDPDYNAKVALRISHGGTTWDAWECRP